MNWLVTSVQQSPWGWGTFLVLGIALIRIWPQLRKLKISEHEQIRTEYLAEIGLLRAEVLELRRAVELLREENWTLKLVNARYENLPCQTGANCPVNLRSVS